MTVADLVVYNDGDAVVGGEVPEGGEILVTRARTAVEGDQRGGGGGGEVADDTVPRVAWFVDVGDVEGDLTLFFKFIRHRV